MARQVMSDAEMDGITKTTKQQLDEQPKVKVRLYLAPEDKRKIEAAKEAGKNVEIPYEVVSVNGYTYQIQRGTDVNVPQTVAEILEQAGLI